MMKRCMEMQLLIAALTVFLMNQSTLAFAYDDGKKIGLSSVYHVCMSHSGGVTASMLDCDGNEQDFQNRRLDSIYRRLLDDLPEGQRHILKDNEQSWIKTRESKCVQPEGSGTMGAINYSSCFLGETARHATKLENMLKRIRP